MNSKSDLFDLSGRIAIVTGSARGLGRAMAEGLAGAGAKIVISGRTLQEVESTAAEFATAGHDAVGIAFDATKRDDCQRLVESAVDHFGRLDIMIANHGGGSFSGALDFDDEGWNQTLAVNLTGAFYCCQLAARQMVAQGGGGSIIVTSSTASTAAFPTLLAYGVAKGGVDQMVRQMALEWGQYAIRVNAINPGYTTHRPRGPAYDPESETEREINRATPLGRSGEPHEFSGPAIFLTSDASSFVTGVCLAVDGGYLTH